MLWTVKAERYLKKYWKIDNLKDKQIEVINELLLGEDVIGLLPTGYGKSMCYLIPPLVSKKVMFIISPLISLMDDQKDKLDKIGVKSVVLHSNNKSKDKDIYEIINGKVKIVYMSPEYLIKSDGLELASILNEENKLGFLAVDESHCISVWGQDFRVEYTKLKMFRDYYPDIPILAVTATATDNVCNDITKLLCLKNPKLIRASFDRPNLYLKVLEVPTIPIIQNTKGKLKTVNKNVPKEDLAIEYINKYKYHKIIIYINSRKDAEELSILINKKINTGSPNIVEAYHAGLSKNIRESIQNKFIENKINVIVSTIAFGMGIDQKVKCVIIFGCPSSIEEYYQQIGRAGRTGEECETILYFDYSKLMIGKHILKDIKTKSPILYKSKLDNLTKVGSYAYLKTCRRKYVLEYFNEECNFFTCNKCDNCHNLKDITEHVYPLIMQNVNLINAVTQIKNKYLTENIDLFDSIYKWKNYINKNKIKYENIPEELKIKIQTKYIKFVENNCDKYEYYEKLLTRL